MIAKAMGAAVAAGLLASCSAIDGGSQAVKEYFSPAKYGPASPRVVTGSKSVPKGGGRYMVGKPYRVAGKTYIPRDEPRYSATGMASWYGAAFHGRQTANGEVYDVNGLTAAHPTLPLPSYVRVTNLGNGRSLVVRVNDRGPFAHDRIIDVSSKVADILDFKKSGTAKVKVEYVGPAQMDGRDTKMLLASYQGPGAPAKRGLFGRPAAGSFMVASASPPQRLPDEAFQPTPVTAGEPVALAPGFGPNIAPDDPLAPLIREAGLIASYVEIKSMSAAHEAAADLARPDLGQALQRAAARKAHEIGGPPAIVQVGTFSDRTNAERVAAEFRRFGKAETHPRDSGGHTLHIVRVVVGSQTSPDAVLSAASAAGLPGAFLLSN